jgi:GNAT superfamily N-acetyltransferase
MAALIEHLDDLTSQSLGDLVAESEQSGLRFVRRLVEEWATGANRFDRAGEALFGAWVDGRLVGVCGLNVDSHAGDERIGRLRHLYVLSAFRRHGIGRQLVARVIQAAQGRFDDVRLRTNNPAAARLYEMLGFHRCVGRDDCTHVARPAGDARCPRAGIARSRAGRPCG